MLIVLIVSNLTGWALASFFKGGNNTAYVSNFEIYEAFEGKKELEKQFTLLQQRQKAQLDTIKLEVEVLTKELEVGGGKDKKTIEKLKQKQTVYMRLSEEFYKKEQSQKEQYMDQIWNQINSYVQDFGKEKGYDFIYGANASGSLMFANSNKDITEEVIAYINEKYEGN